MAFVQLVEFTSSQTDEIRTLGNRYQSEVEGKSTVKRTMVCADKDTPNRYVVIAEFDSAEDAEANSNLAETQAFAEEMGKLLDGPPSYRNLEVVESFEA